MITLKAGVFCIGVAALMMQIVPLQAAESKPIPPGPIPTQISLAKKVFIANGGQSQPYKIPIFAVGPERAYDEFFAAVKASRLYPTRWITRRCRSPVRNRTYSSVRRFEFPGA